MENQNRQTYRQHYNLVKKHYGWHMEIKDEILKRKNKLDTN